MLLSRMLVATALAGLAATSLAHAADTTAFAVVQHDSNGQPTVFQSVSLLKRGDVLKIHAFNAQPDTVLRIAMCDRQCPAMHIVQTVPLFFALPGVPVTNQRVALPQDGRVVFWVQRADSIGTLPFMTASGVWDMQQVNPFITVFRPITYGNPQAITPASAVKLDDDTLHARFQHHTFVTVSLADAGS